jgi:hypothetical protein
MNRIENLISELVSGGYEFVNAVRFDNLVSLIQVYNPNADYVTERYTVFTAIFEDDFVTVRRCVPSYSFENAISENDMVRNRNEDCC